MDGGWCDDVTSLLENNPRLETLMLHGFSLCGATTLPDYVVATRLRDIALSGFPALRTLQGVSIETLQHCQRFCMPQSTKHDHSEYSTNPSDVVISATDASVAALPLLFAHLAKSPVLEEISLCRMSSLKNASCLSLVFVSLTSLNDTSCGARRWLPGGILAQSSNSEASQF